MPSREARKQAFFRSTPNIIGLAILCTLLWGSAFPAVKIGYQLFAIATADVPDKLLFAGLRFGSSGLLILVFAGLTARAWPLPPVSAMPGLLPRLLVLGLLQTTLQYVFFYTGLANTTGVNSSILTSSGIFLSFGIAHFLYANDRLSPARILGCLAGLAGVILVAMPQSAFGAAAGALQWHFNSLGDGFIILSAFFGAIGQIYNKQLSGRLSPMLLSGWQLLWGGLVLILAGLLSGGSLPVVTPTGLLLLLYMALLSAVAFTVWAYLFKYNTVGKISVYQFLIPIFGAALSAIFLSESIFQVKTAISLVLVCGGIFLVNRD